ncbi:MAG: hypothetical protein U0942_15990 [Parvibaculum sp.]|uniref:hypothetical protein n=1 Tax=Parvibaculum sp. TaxID=2024848 RepID=UPI002AB9DA5B|nr:hypothetical protein [Parvibaculum sp.]MDZ4382833.1 hypothetical protein [Parvibaculum sp.]
MSDAARISEFMVAAGAFSVDPGSRGKEEINRLVAHYLAVKPLIAAPCERAVGHAVAAIGREGVTERTVERLRTALAGRVAGLASAQAEALVPPVRQVRFPYKDD